MTPERWQEVERLYHAVAARPEAERGPLLDRECGLDTALRAEVERMLAAEGDGAGFLDEPAVKAAVALPERISPGSRLGPYEVLSFIGAGGMGRVYKARDSRLNRLVAIKVLAGFAPDDARRNRLLREARAASALNHPGIVAVHDILSDSGRDALVMDYVEGDTLEKKLERGRMPVDQALHCAIRIAEALAAAHGVGVVHRDVKPGNVIVTGGSDAIDVKVVDFGLAKMEHAPGSVDTASVTIPGTLAGTLAYMSPEQASGKPLDGRTDIFSLGVVLYEMLEGRRPFTGGSQVEVLQRIANESPPAVGGHVPPEVRWILEKALEKNPADRYQFVKEFAVDLRRASRGKAPSPAPVASSRRANMIPWIAVAALAALIVLLAFRPSSALENPLANARFTRLTDFEGAEHGAAVSPDGRWIAFRSDREGPFDIWLTQVGTGRFTNLTQGKVDEGRYPVRTVGFTGDGSEIWMLGGPDYRLRIMPLMGGAPRPFLGAGVIGASWSPDNSRIVYHTADIGDPMFVADRTGASPRRIYEGPYAGWHNHFQTWSTDGLWIYFVGGRATANEMDLYRVSAAGGSPERLTEHRSDIAYPTPIDARTVLYVVRDRDGSGPWLWALDLGRKTNSRVSFGLERYTSIAASGDGRRLVATVANPSATLFTAPILQRLAEESDVKPFSVSNVNAQAPRFGGGSLFYLSSRGSGEGLWRQKDGQSLEIWSGANGPLLESPAISPDGRRIAIVLRRDGRMRLHLVFSDGSENQPVAAAMDAVGSPDWSPDGRWLVTGGDDGSGSGLFKVPVDGGAVVRLASGPALNPVWSPRDDLIVYQGPEVAGGLPLLAVTSEGARVELPPIAVRGTGERMRFLPDGSALVYLEGPAAEQEFAILDLTSRKTRRLTRLRRHATTLSFDIAPDARSIVFDHVRENSDIVLIDLPPERPRR
jgi:serine/threonine protein kinase/Tol biopolymer transport system component